MPQYHHHQLGLRRLVGGSRLRSSRAIPSPLPRMARHAGDGLRIRSRPVRTKCVELGMSPTFHAVTKGVGKRVSRSNVGYNQIGHFGEADEISESVEWLCSE